MGIRTRVCTGLVAIAVIALSGGAATADQPSSPIGPASAVCFSTHNFSSGNNALNICFSNHGNLIKFTSPAGFEHIQLGTIAEGYSITDIGSGVSYYDFGSFESGFGAPSIAQPNGANTFPLTITRSTTDGIYQLRQVFSWNTATKQVTIAMTVVNNTTVTRTIHLTRYFDGDIDNIASDDFYARTNASVIAWNDGDGAHGLVLTSQSLNTTKSTSVTPFSTGTVPTPATFTTPTAQGDYEGYLQHTLSIPGRGNRAATVTYKRI